MSFPAAASVALRDSQLRRNLHKATTTIREKRAGVVAELPDWQALRTAEPDAIGWLQAQIRQRLGESKGAGRFAGPAGSTADSYDDY